MARTRGANCRRARTGCLTCRARKIKCDEATALCNNCSRSQIECVQSGNQGLSQATRSELALRAQGSPAWTEAGLERRRIKRSCLACRLVKKRCGGERPRCDRCRDRRIDCTYNVVPEEKDVADIRFPDQLLADKTVLRELCDAFFKEIPGVRCLGFLHRPTFLQTIEGTVDIDDPLLLAVCALATKTVQKRDLWDVGCEWAKRAQKIVFERIDNISVHMLRCIVLLHEHSARISALRLCFLLSSMASRYAQALSLNLEYDHDILCLDSQMTAVEKESRRRLMWACYILDSRQASGLNHLQTLHGSTTRIQLPCNDKKFLYKVACRTATVSTRDIAEDSDVSMSCENQGMLAFTARLYLIHEKIQQYINSRTDEKDPWRITSLIAYVEHWKASLPPDLLFTSDVIAIRKEESLLSALISLHILYHQVNCLLNRCTIPSMLFPARDQSGLSMRASPDFLSESRKGWFDHACAMTRIFEVALEHSPVSMTDPAVSGSAYNAIIIKWLYLTNFVPPQERLHKMEEILPLVSIDLQFLHELHSFHPCVEYIHSAAQQLVNEAKIRIPQSPATRLSETDYREVDAGHVVDRTSPDYNTNPLSIISQMRMELPDVHAGESRDGSHGRVGRGLWVWT